MDKNWRLAGYLQHDVSGQLQAAITTGIHAMAALGDSVAISAARWVAIVVPAVASHRVGLLEHTIQLRLGQAGQVHTRQVSVKHRLGRIDELDVYKISDESEQDCR